MRKSILMLTTTLLVLAGPALAEEAAGIWSGVIDNHLLSLVRIEKAQDGSYTGTFTDHEQPLDKPDPNAVTDTPLSHVVATADHLSFDVPAIGDAIFDGQWDAARHQWNGTLQWGKGGYKSVLNLKRTEAIHLADTLKPRIYASKTEEIAEMEALIDGYVKDERFMGTILVSQSGHVLIDKGYGFANLASGIPNTSDTPYHIASITKPFTATAILMLQDRGKLNIDDPIGKYIADTSMAWDGITLRHLLTHTSGMGDYIPALKGRYDQPITPTLLTDIVRGLPLEFKPGEKSQYSNAGFILLGAVIEKVSGQSFGDFMHANIFAPLHMDATAYDPASEGPEHALGYDVGDNGPVLTQPWNLSVSYAAGGLVSTSHDLLRWQEALFGGRLISAKALTDMQTQGLGISRITAEGHTLYTHGGHVPGYVSGASYQPDGQLAIIVLGNLDNSSPAWIASALTTIAHGFPADVVPLPKAIEVAPEILAQYAGTYVLMPGFNLVVTVEGGHLVVQASGQDKVNAYPESETMFFAKTVEAKLEFVHDKDGRIDCILHQAGQNLRGVRQ